MPSNNNSTSFAGGSGGGAGGASSHHSSGPPPIAGIGMSNDALVFMYPLLHRLVEKGASLPFRFPDTVCYEHHFPRGWFSVEREPAAAAALRQGGAEPLPMEKLRSASPFLKATAPLNDKHKQRREKGGRGDVEDHRLVLVRRVAKECDSGIIRKAFSCTAASPIMGAICVSRNPASDELRMQYLDDVGLADALMASPETCLMSKFVPSRRPRFDVLVATWTPSVFSVEHRENRHLLSDESLSVQQRGDVTNPSQYQELQCSSLTAQRVRDDMFAFMSCVATYERKYIGEIRAYFRTDGKERLWFLWCDVCRFAVPRAVSGMSVMVRGGEDPSALWDRIEREVAWRKTMDAERSAVARVTGSGPAQDREGESEHEKLKRLSSVHYGRHPSFIKVEDDADLETIAVVEAKLQAMLRKAKPGGSSLSSSTSVPRRSRAGMHGGGSLSPTQDRGGKASWLSQKAFAGSSWDKPCDGLVPMVPLSLQPLPIMFDASSSNRPQSQQSRTTSPVEATRATSKPVRSMAQLSQELIQESGVEMSSSVVMPSSAFPQRQPFVTSPSFAPSPSSNSDDRPSPTAATSPSPGATFGSDTNRRKSSIVKVASRSQDAQGTPSKWMRAVASHASNSSVVVETPRQGREDRRESGRPMRDRTTSFVGPAAANSNAKGAAKRRSSDTSTEAEGDDVRRGRAVRPFVPSEKRLQRARASVVLGQRADMLDISARLEYNDLKRQHQTAMAELEDVQYIVTSEAMKSRESVPILFDIPRGAPKVPDAIIQRCGFSLVADDAEMDRMFLERYYFMAHTIHIGWAFEHLKAAVEDLCYEDQFLFWRRSGGTEASALEMSSVQHTRNGSRAGSIDLGMSMEQAKHQQRGGGGAQLPQSNNSKEPDEPYWEYPVASSVQIDDGATSMPV